MLRLAWLSILALSTGCVVPQSGVSRDQYEAKEKEVTALQAEIQKLQKALDAKSTSPATLLADANAALRSKDFDRARQLANTLGARHPNTPEARQARQIVESADSAVRAAEQAHRAEVERAIAGMVKKRDEMRNLTVWRDPAMPAHINTRQWVGAYIMAPDQGGPTMRFAIYYTADDWLFIERYLLKVDGVSFAFKPETFGDDAVERDNGSGDIWEWWDVVAEGDKLGVLEALAAAKTATIRYEGRQYYRDRSIGPAERAAIKRTLAAYNVLKSRS